MCTEITAINNSDGLPVPPTVRRILRLHGAQQQRVLGLITNVCHGYQEEDIQYVASHL